MILSICVEKARHHLNRASDLFAGALAFKHDNAEALVGKYVHDHMGDRQATAKHVSLPDVALSLRLPTVINQPEPPFQISRMPSPTCRTPKTLVF